MSEHRARERGNIKRVSEAEKVSTYDRQEERKERGRGKCGRLVLQRVELAHLEVKHLSAAPLLASATTEHS